MKTKFFTRICLVVLALATLFTFAACNQPSQPESPTEAPSQPEGTQPGGTAPSEGTPTQQPNVDPEGPDLPTTTFGGSEFKVYIRGWGNETQFNYASELFVGYELEGTPTSLDRAVYERMSFVEDTYDVTFDVQTQDNCLDKNVVDTSAKTGTDVYDLLADHGCQIFANVQKNLMLDYANLPYVDTTQPWWNQDANTSLRTAGGKLFGMLGDIGYTSLGSTFVMFFNKDVINNIQGLTSPYEKVYEDGWTFATFEEYVTTAGSNMDRDNSGEIATDSFGYGTAEWRGPVQAFYSTGERVLVRKNNEWRFTLDKDITNRALFDLRELLYDSGVAYLKRSADYSDLRAAFVSNRVAFFDDNLLCVAQFKGTDLNFGLLPWPKYNDEVEEYYSAVDAGTNVYAVLRNTTEENAERISIILEALAYYGYRDIMPFYYDTILSYQYLKDEDAINMLNIIHENLVVELACFIGNTMAWAFRTTVISTDGSASLGTAVSENMGTAENELKSWDDLDKEN